VLQQAGFSVGYDTRQTCCGQPLLNGGYVEEAEPVCRHFLDVFASGSSPLVSPSGSCVSMVRDHYRLIGMDSEQWGKWEKVNGRIVELAEFLVERRLEGCFAKRMAGKVVVHQSCHFLRHIGGAEPLTKLLKELDGLEVIEGAESTFCCGFGGVFSVRQPELSVAMGRRRLADCLQSEPDAIVVPDAGCILQLRQILSAMELSNPPVVVHYAQLLAATSLEELVAAGGRSS